MAEAQNSARGDEAPAGPIRSIVTVLGWGIALALILYFLNPFKTLLLGLIAAASLAMLLKPLVRRIPLARGWSAAIVGIGAVLLILAMLAGVGLLLARPIRDQLVHWPRTKERLDQIISDYAGRLGVESPPSIEQLAVSVLQWLTGSGSQIISGTAGALVSVLVAAALVLIGSIYILADPPGQLLAPIERMLPLWRRPQLRAAVADLEPRLRGWLIGTLVSMSIVGVTSGIGYTLIGLSFALPLAIFAALAEMIPTVGPLIALVVGLILAGVQGTSQLVGVLVIYVIVQTLESYLIQPLVMRQAVNIPPIVTLFTVILWGQVFGAPGLLLAIPINLFIWSMVDHFVLRTRPPLDAR